MNPQLYHLFSRAAGQIIQRHVRWPRADGGPIEGLDPDLVYLRIEAGDMPSFNPLTQTARPTEAVDVEAGVVVVSYVIEDLPARVKTWPAVQQFMSEFEFSELAAIGKSADDTIAALRLVLTTWGGIVRADDQRVQLGVSRLVELGIISADRAAAILGN